MMTKLEHFQVFEDLLKDIHKNLNKLKECVGETKERKKIEKILKHSLHKTTYPELVKLNGHLKDEYENEKANFKSHLKDENGMAKWIDIEIKKYNEGLLSPWQMKALEELPYIQDELKKV